MKVIKSLENSGILSKGTTRKITSQEGGLLNFLLNINEKCTQTIS